MIKGMLKKVFLTTDYKSAMLHEVVKHFIAKNGEKKQLKNKPYLVGKITSRVTRKTIVNTTNSVSQVLLQPVP